MELSGERCVACRPDSPRVSDEALPDLLAEVPMWELLETNGTRKLRRTFRFDGWTPAVHFVDLIAGEAEAEDHHPSINLSWGKVMITWWTHAIGGLHRNDFVMAARCDQIRDEVR